MGGKAGRKRIVKEFTEYTSTHGIPNVGRSVSKLMIAFWTIVTLGAFGALVFMCSRLIIKYFEFHKKVGMELKFERRDFPAVTICDLNPYKDTIVQTVPDMQRLVMAKDFSNSDYDQAELETIDYEIHKLWDISISTSCGTFIDAYAYAVSKSPCAGALPCQYTNATMEAELAAFGLKDLNDVLALRSKVGDLLVMVTAKLTEQQMRPYAAELNETIRAASFNTKAIDIQQEFVTFTDPKMGHCFTFNKPNPSQYHTLRAGPAYGLKLVLFTQVDAYLPFSESSGFRIVIHNSTAEAFPDTYGYDVFTGSAASMGVTYKQMHRMGPPHGECTREGNMPAEHIYEGGYTSEGCQRGCVQREVEAECKCSDPNYPGGQFDTCKPLDSIQRECWYDIATANEHHHDEDCSACGLPCGEGVFRTTVSSATWPSTDKLKIADCHNHDLPPPYENCQQMYKENGAYVEVFYSILNYESYQESEEYPFVQLASDFGGQIGLWLGLSVISVIEFFVLIGLLIHNSRKKDDNTGTRGHSAASNVTGSAIVE